MSPLELFLLLAIPVLASLVAVLVATRTRREELPLPDGRGLLSATTDNEDVVYLFDGRRLLDATPRAQSLLPHSTPGIDDWGRFLLAFGDRFEDIEPRLNDLLSGQRVSLVSSGDEDDGLTLEARRHLDLTRIGLRDPRSATRSQLVERYSLMAMRAELNTLRSVAEESPVITWKQRHDGTIVWANSAYMAMLQRETAGESLFTWPPQDMFGLLQAQEQTTRRISLKSQHAKKTLWFELTSLPGTLETLHFAMPIDGLVRAETALSGFVQTLTKTFAHLTVGLAVFDRHRRLALFNPALVDLTGLPAELLSRQPGLHEFLDALRERQRIPEPKDYKSWRLQIAQLEAGAAEGNYTETWDLPNGQTYRVTGRPHPDGAVAYVFEDISTEVSLTRSFRSEIAMGQSILDSLDQAIAVFSRSGVLTMANRAYREMWAESEALAANGIGIDQVTEQWQARCHPGEACTRMRDGILNRGDRSAWATEVFVDGWGPAIYTVKPLAAGAMMVSFSALRSPLPVSRELRRTGT